jgi:hypothetical protein
MVFGEVSLKYITFVFIIPNNVGLHSHKIGNENLLDAKNECHVLPSGENCVLFSKLPLQYMEFSTKFLTQMLSSYAVYIPIYVKNAFSHVRVATHFLELTTVYFHTQKDGTYSSIW